ncbi:MAG: deoxyribonuclease V [Thermodesulfovibrionales bacterium]|nr:deoxyribonuclease V [Thermodesulfovibrionales bacterium]
MDYSMLLNPKSLDDAKIIQKHLQKKIRVEPLLKKPRIISAVDAAFYKSFTIATACSYEYDSLVLIEEAFSIKETSFPYIPGFLAFREGPAMIEAIEKLQAVPDVIIFDGHGIAHPFGIGIASHIGVILDMPTIGCAKSRLIGEFEGLDTHKGSYSYLTYKKNIIGAVLRTKDNVSPIYVSVGHKIDLKTSLNLILHATGKYRIPIPVRHADLLTKRIKRDISKK